MLEISSFQLETIESFRPEIAAILNITPDHLDRHHTFANYASAKERVFENQSANDYAVLNADNEPCVKIGKRLKSQVLWFSRLHDVKRGAFLRGETIVYRDGKDQGPVGARHAAERRAQRRERARRSLRREGRGSGAGADPQGGFQFKAVEHRLEYTATVNGVEYYNDSKATNVDATIKALESFSKGVHLILGGKDKGSPYTVSNDLLHERVKTVYTIGAAASKIEAEVSGVEVVHAETLENAVKLASEKAGKGDVVLLAPACASFTSSRATSIAGECSKNWCAACRRGSRSRWRSG